MKKIKKLILSCLMIVANTVLFAQDGMKSEEIKISPKSELTITGKTNINKFKCDFDASCFQDIQEIRYVSSGSKIKFENAVLVLQNINFDCGNRSINKDFHALLKTEKYPKILLEVKKIELNSKGKAMADVEIFIAGKRKSYVVPINISETGNLQQFEGNLELNIRDFNLEPPKKMFGAIVVKEDIEIDFNLKVKS